MNSGILVLLGLILLSALGNWLMDPPWLRAFLSLLPALALVPLLRVGRKVPGPEEEPEVLEAAAESEPDAMEEGEACEERYQVLTADLRKRFEELRALVRNLQQANNAAKSLTILAETQKHTVGSIINDSNLIQINANQAYAIADNIAGSATEAFALSGRVQVKVESLAEEMSLSLQETEVLIEESRKISSIIEIMNQIAASTHVLSINASIVAARAGIHGRAFDVVSKEIRALAQNTSSSLSNIERLVGDIQSRILQVAERIKLSSRGILSEKDSLLSVAGSLQGVSLAVEVIRTVSSMSSEKAAQLQKDADGISGSLDILASNVSKSDTLSITDALYHMIDELEKALES